MADLIALLLSALASLLVAGGDTGTFNRQLAETVVKQQPVPIGAAEIECRGLNGSSLEQLQFGLKELLLDPLLIDEAAITVRDIKLVETGKIDLGGIHWLAQISEEELTKALRSHVKQLSDATVDISKQAIVLRGHYTWWKLQVPYEVSGNLRIESNTQLIFVIDQTGVSGVNVPLQLNRLIENEINPVYDLAEFANRNKDEIRQARDKLSYEFKLVAQEIKLGDGHIIVSGDA